jgi:bifunctional UDP-N-acetylglucosamine pyrophosphorylase / glucosamine-1-phosphate N-acetyltransferase
MPSGAYEPLWKSQGPRLKPTGMTDRPIAAIILAAGKGTRMKSDLHKVLHPIAGRPMLEHLLATVDQLRPAQTVVVVGDRREQVEAAVASRGVKVVTQEPQLGTGHAVLQAREALSGFDGDVLILFGDVPLVSADTLRAMAAELAGQPDAAAIVLGFRPDDPAAYGRIVADDDGSIGKMVEYKDASPEERAVTLCNSGMMLVRSADLWPLLDRVGNDNAAGEYYLPDIVMLALADGRRSLVVEAPVGEMGGVNSRADLAELELLWQRQARTRLMAEGVSLVAPETIWLSFDTSIGRDTIVEPQVFFGPGVTIGERVRIRAFSHIEGATVAKEAVIGPYARLRPGSQIGAGAHIGNFVETKQAKIGAGAKANHLTYLGDVEVGARSNIGAGTITCNYDGFFKYGTKIGEGAFIGSNSALVAPVTIGDGAIVGAGSVITSDVAPDSLGVARGKQEGYAGWARRFRERMRARKKG